MSKKVLDYWGSKEGKVGFSNENLHSELMPLSNHINLHAVQLSSVFLQPHMHNSTSSYKMLSTHRKVRSWTQHEILAILCTKHYTLKAINNQYLSDVSEADMSIKGIKAEGK